MPQRKTIDDFIARVELGHYDTAIELFYADDASMQENFDPPRQGRDLLVTHERGVMGTFAKITAQHVGPVLVEGDHSVIRWKFEFHTRDGKTMTLDELTYQRWRGEKIVEERFYYDPKQMRG
ncbi:MAG TPA: nuclear transport factor 2 family protein [Rhizomicrobium sp.]|jgi:ketosteroid isomerase-like protein|nr:nuclear transport factor 2 family protein [Rhizomicrobium sp.]HEX4534393.1 nuclear transport factor 2 family protein [Rhizomicrobium sp.]